MLLLTKNSKYMLLKENAIRKEKIKAKNSDYYVYYFHCLECNKEIKAQTSQLLKHSGKCQRCGHLGEPYLFIYNELKNHRSRKVEFSLTFEELKTLITHFPKCHYCDIDLVYNEHSRHWSKNLTRAHQLDRKDNSKGYFLDNIVTCCWTCNRLKSNVFTYEEFCLLKPVLKDIQKRRKIKNCSLEHNTL